MSLARKSFLAFATVIVITIVTATAVVALARSSSASIAAYRTRTHRLQQAVTRTETFFYAFDDQMNMYVAVLAGGGGASERQLAEDTYQQAVAARERLARALVSAKRDAGAAHAEAAVARIQKDFEGYDGFAKQSRAAAQQGDVKRALWLTTVGNVGPSNDMMPALAAASRLATRADDAQLDAVTRRQHQTILFATLGGILTVALVVGLALLVKRQMVRRIVLASTRMRQISDGDADLTQRLTIYHDDELGDLGRNFNSFVEGVQGVVVSLVDNAASLERAASELSAVSTEAEHSATAARESSASASDVAGDVADRVQAVAASAEEMDASIREIAENANAAAQRAGEAVTSAHQTGALVERLGEGSAKIGEVIGLITSIAEQTNLLALNATIEAARAGEAGKGFAVVASEVKDLAQETSHATDDIHQRVTTIQQDVTTAIASINEIAHAIEELEGHQTAVASSVEEQAATTRLMTEDVGRAASGVQQIATDIASAAAASGATGDGIAHARQSATEVAAMSEQLHVLAGRFRA